MEGGGGTYRLGGSTREANISFRAIATYRTSPVIPLVTAVLKYNHEIMVGTFHGFERAVSQQLGRVRPPHNSRCSDDGGIVKNARERGREREGRGEQGQHGLVFSTVLLTLYYCRPMTDTNARVRHENTKNRTCVKCI